MRLLRGRSNESMYAGLVCEGVFFCTNCCVGVVLWTAKFTCEPPGDVVALI